MLVFCACVLTDGSPVRMWKGFKCTIVSIHVYTDSENVRD